MSKKVTKGLKSLGLLAPTKIRALEDQALKMLNGGVEMVCKVTRQWALHAEQHGDIMGMQAWIQRLHNEADGLVVAGLVKWVHDFTPIRLKSENGVVESKLLKEGEAGFVPFKTEEMGDVNPMKSSDVTNRAQRPIEPFSISLIKSRIEGLKGQLERALEQGGRGIIGNKEVMAQYLSDLNEVKVRPVKVGQKTVSYDPKVEEALIAKAKADQAAKLAQGETLKDAA